MNGERRRSNTGYSLVARDESPGKAADDAADAREFGKTVHVQYKGARVAIPSALIAAAISALGTFYATHSTPVDCASKGDVNALDVKVSKLADEQRTLTGLVNANADRNHNDIAILNGTLLALTRQK